MSAECAPRLQPLTRSVLEFIDRVGEADYIAVGTALRMGGNKAHSLMCTLRNRGYLRAGSSERSFKRTDKPIPPLHVPDADDDPETLEVSRRLPSRSCSSGVVAGPPYARGFKWGAGY